MTGRDIVIGFYVKNDGDWMKIYDDIKNQTIIEDEKEFLNSVKEFEKKHKKVITIVDEDYPDELKMIYKPPFVLVED